MKVTEFYLKWVRVARNGLMLKQDEAIVWLRIISRPLYPKMSAKKPHSSCMEACNANDRNVQAKLATSRPFSA